MKTKKKHFKIFKRECKKWIKFFGLNGHRFYYQHNNDVPNSLAYCLYPEKHEDRVFTIGLSKKLKFKYSMKDIKRSAFHEIIEALLYRIQNIAESRYIQPEEINDEIHNIVRTLENSVFKQQNKGE